MEESLRVLRDGDWAELEEKSPAVLVCCFDPFPWGHLIGDPAELGSHIHEEIEPVLRPDRE